MSKKSTAPPPTAPASQLPPSITKSASSSPLLAHVYPSPAPSLRIYTTQSSTSSNLVLDLPLGEGLGMATSAVWCETDESADGNASNAASGGSKKKRKAAASATGKDPILALAFHSGVVHLYSGSSSGANWKFLTALPAASTVGPVSAMSYSSSHGLALALLPTPAAPRPSLSLYANPLGSSSSAKHYPVPTTLAVTPITALAFVPQSQPNQPPALLLGSNSIHLVSLTSTNATTVVSTFPGGHSTTIRQLEFIPAANESSPASVVTIAESDRSASVWELPAFPHEPRLKSIVPLASDIVSIALSHTSPRQLALQTLSHIYLFALPASSDVVAPSPKNKKNSKPTVLSASSTLSIIEAPSSTPASILTVAFVLQAEGKIGWARALGGRGLVWEDEEYMEDGAWKGDVEVERRGVGEVLKSSQGVAGTGAKPTTRYHEPNATSLSTTSATLPGVPTSAPALAPTLGELLSVPPLAPVPSTSNGETQAGGSTTTPLSLSRLLTQALHSSDAPLLSQCLSHSDPALIRSTVRRLQPELSVILLERLGERLALGGKGKAGGASAQRVKGVGAWTRGVLRERVGYLMTVPDLLPRLAPLHSLLSTRLQLQTPLLSLSGRLELALAQIESRQQEQARSLKGESKVGGTYVEGESDDESDEGDVEDVGLGGDSSDEDDDGMDVDMEGEELSEDDDDEDDDEDNESLSGSEDDAVASAFIDDEASDEGSEGEDESDGADEE